MSIKISKNISFSPSNKYGTENAFYLNHEVSIDEIKNNLVIKNKNQMYTRLFVDDFWILVKNSPTCAACYSSNKWCENILNCKIFEIILSEDTELLKNYEWYNKYFPYDTNKINKEILIQIIIDICKIQKLKQFL